MKNKIYTASFLMLFSIGVGAQTPLPYFTGFDNAAQQSGWQSFRTGFAGAYDWVYNTFGAYSAPNCIYHDYPVGSSSNDTTVDWFVSPMFNFSSGAKIDSIRINLYVFTGSTTPVDYCGVYLLKGSNNPALATTKTELVNLTGFASSSNLWRDTGNINIPATPGNCCIAVRYRATNNWFVANVDNIRLSSGPAGIARAADPVAFGICPNPASERLYFSGLNDKDFVLTLINEEGRVIKSFNYAEIGNNNYSIDISALSPGVYLIKAENKGITTFRKFIKL